MQSSERIRGALQRAAIRGHQRSEGPPRTQRKQLVEWAASHLRDRQVIVVSNREPYSHERDGQGLRWVRTVGGLTVALDAVAQALGGVWVASGSGSADRDTVDAHDRVRCPPDRPRYTLRRVWLSERDHALYYSGF